ncbi:MAG: site-specific DNA-methyltransferase, partial [Paraprevotella sp.]|nr:site-specific DNA-methyltransferase [Paraprevotella sp.]
IKEQQTMAQFDEGSGFKESYMLEYMLDVETRDSLLNLKMFENPFALTLKTNKDNELVETEVDMVETFNYSEFDLIYVNSDNLLSNLRRDEDKWKVVLIEEEFTKRLFETE